MSFLSKALRKRLSPEQFDALRRAQAHRYRGLQHFLYRIFVGKNLKTLARIYNTDKWGNHWYAQHYERHFAHLRNRRLNILEIGIGGYDDPKAGGGSLRMWRNYFSKANIYGIDIEDKSPHNERRIRTFKGSQVDPEFLNKVIKEIGSVDIIIDDGSHLNEHVIFTFKHLFPLLAQNGFYVVEDMQTSYWKEYGGTSERMDDPKTMMAFFKGLVDGINHQEFELSQYKPSYFDQNIVGMHFYHNLMFIEKGVNNEGSNVLPRRW